MSPSHAHYRPPDHSKGDESTIGGYAAVNDRPAAFEGSDGFSYSVELMTEQLGDEQGSGAPPWAAFILFVKWSRLGAQSPEGHLESDYLVHADSDAEARRMVGAMPLEDVKALLERLITERNAGAPTRRWWDAMRDEGSEGEGA
jgi:hypothetical protein